MGLWITKVDRTDPVTFIKSVSYGEIAANIDPIQS